MPRTQEREDARRLYLEGMRLVDIAKKLDVPEGTVRRWKHTYNWDSERSDEQKANVRRKRGGQPGNKNSVGHGAPKGNKNAEKHGFFSKWLPEETAEIIKEIESTHPLDILWDNIQLQYAAIIRAQKLMYVQDQEDKTVEQIGYQDGKVVGEKWEVQQAWDKHANFLNAQSRAMKTLESMIKNYEELLNKNWDIATEEQKLRVDKLRQEIASDKQTDEVVRIIDDI